MFGAVPEKGPNSFVESPEYQPSMKIARSSTPTLSSGGSLKSAAALVKNLLSIRLSLIFPDVSSI